MDKPFNNTICHKMDRYVSFYPLINLKFETIRINWPKTILIFRGIIGLTLLIICMSDINGSDFNPFIYFRF